MNTGKTTEKNNDQKHTDKYERDQRPGKPQDESQDERRHEGNEEHHKR